MPRGHEIVGLAPAWHSADLGIAAVDATGEITGVTPGRTLLTAELSGFSARLAAEVVPVPGLAHGGERRGPARAGRAASGRAGGRAGGLARRPADRRGSGTLRHARTAERVEPAVDTSDAQGVARATWTLGPLPGPPAAVAGG